MGHHWVPRKYLEGFAVEGEKSSIWQFDKQTRRFSTCPLSISKVAQQSEYNDPLTEVILTNHVEVPINPILDELRSGGSLREDHRRPLSEYMATMYYRVPAKRQMAASKYSDCWRIALERRLNIARTQATEAGLCDHETEEILSEIVKIFSKYKDVPPEEGRAQINSPWPSRECIDAIFQMHWQLVRAAGATFVTTDNPMFVFDCWGFAHEKSEFTFPISRDLAIFGSKREHDSPEAWSHELVVEANRRAVCNASRFVYCHERNDWLVDLVGLTTTELSVTQ